MGASRDFGTEGAGKGDSDRTTDRDAYASNYSEIDWSPKAPKFVPVPVNPISSEVLDEIPEFASGPDTEPGFDFNCPTTDIIRE